jgi:hypothetical protein
MGASNSILYELKAETQTDTCTLMFATALSAKGGNKGSVAESLLSMHQALDSISSPSNFVFD